MRDNIFKLSNNVPTNKAKAKRVTQSNSAVNRRFSAKLVYIIKNVKIKKKVNKIKFTSPINKNS